MGWVVLSCKISVEVTMKSGTVKISSGVPQSAPRTKASEGDLTVLARWSIERASLREMNSSVPLPGRKYKNKLEIERTSRMLTKIQVMALMSTFDVSAMKTATMINVDKKIQEAAISVPRMK